MPAVPSAGRLAVGSRAGRFQRPALFLFLLLSLLATPVWALPSNETTLPPLRIGLCKYFTGATTLLLTSDQGVTITDSESGKSLAHGTPGVMYKVSLGKTGLRITRAEAGGERFPLDLVTDASADSGGDQGIKIARVDAAAPAKAKWHMYRGTLTLHRQADDTLQVVNTVPIEDYLYGVIPAEIGADTPPEAMKAQAVAARTYALKNRGRFAAEGFDLDDTTRCEGYFGMDGETPRSDAAVDATRGLVLMYHGALIDAPYSTDSGGVTACDSDCPYLQAVRDAPSQDGPDYAADSRYHRWTKSYTPDELQQALAKDARTQVAEFASLTLDGADASGRITTATVTGKDGTTKTVTGPQLRQILGYDVLRSTCVTLTVLPDGDYQFDGKGWGHGLGMSQLGAVAMASPPYRKSYKDILAHYYVGTALVRATDIALRPRTARRGL